MKWFLRNLGQSLAVFIYVLSCIGMWKVIKLPWEQLGSEDFLLIFTWGLVTSLLLQTLGAEEEQEEVIDGQDSGEQTSVPKS